MAYLSPLAQPTQAAAAPIAPAAAPRALPVPVRAGRRAPIWIFGVLIVLAVGLSAYLLTFLGAAASFVAMILALLPLAGVLLVVRLIDRWEPEPFGLTALAVTWGATAAVAIALLVDLGMSVVLPDDGSAARAGLSAVVQAPLVEEAAKGLGIMLVFAVGRRAFDGPVDGVVYAALVAAGFAFTENILYFASSLIEGGVAETTFVFFMRGILSPFAHVMFTAVTGFVIGWAARSGKTARRSWGLWLLGVLGASALHALWNGSALFADFFVLYAVLQVPLFVLFIIGLVMLRREESRLTRERLGDYAAAGWFSAHEVDMLATASGRRHAVAWARGLPGDRSPIMKGFIAEATALAAARQRAITGRDSAAIDDERVYLSRAVAARAALLAHG